METSKKDNKIVLWAEPDKYKGKTIGYDVYVTKCPAEYTDIHGSEYFITAFDASMSKPGLFGKISKKLLGSDLSSRPTLTKDVEKLLGDGMDVELVIEEETKDGKAKHTKKKIKKIEDLYEFYDTSNKIWATAFGFIKDKKE